MAEDPTESKHEAREVDRKLLELLVCPLTKGPLDYDRAARELISWRAGLAYPIRDGVPLMTQDAARALSDEEMARHKSSQR